MTTIAEAKAMTALSWTLWHPGMEI